MESVAQQLFLIFYSIVKNLILIFYRPWIGNKRFAVPREPIRTLYLFPQFHADLIHRICVVVVKAYLPVPLGAYTPPHAYLDQSYLHYHWQ